MTDEITVVIPVGPSATHTQWLLEAIESVMNQGHKVDEILIIDDMAALPDLPEEVTVWQSPWRLGVAHAFNFGVALAKHDLIFFLGSDDTLEPDCIDYCLREYRQRKRPSDTYFFVGVRYSDGRDNQFLPCAAAMVTKGLWRLCGGFPIETSTGASDAALVSIFMRNHGAGKYLGVHKKKPLYNYRVHPGTDTANAKPWQGVILPTRDLVTAQWKPPKWGRM